MGSSRMHCSLRRASGPGKDVPSVAGCASSGRTATASHLPTRQARQRSRHGPGPQAGSSFKGTAATMGALSLSLLAVLAVAPVLMMAPTAAAAQGGAAAPVELNPSILVLGTFDYTPYQTVPPFTSRCTDMVDRALARVGGTRLAWVPTIYWVSARPDKSDVSGYCYMDGDGTNGPPTCVPVTQALIDQFREGLQLCAQLASDVGTNELAVVPHLDEATRDDAAWRNTIVFDPLAKYGGFSYEEVLLNPIADALGAVVKPWTIVHFALQGEMSATVMRYPKSYRRLVDRVRARVIAAAAAKGIALPPEQVQIGLSWNYNAIDLGGLAPPPAALITQAQSATGMVAPSTVATPTPTTRTSAAAAALAPTKPGGFGASGGVDLARLSKAVQQDEAEGVATARPGAVAIVPGAAAAFDAAQAVKGGVAAPPKPITPAGTPAGTASETPAATATTTIPPTTKPAADTATGPKPAPIVAPAAKAGAAIATTSTTLPTTAALLAPPQPVATEKTATVTAATAAKLTATTPAANPSSTSSAPATVAADPTVPSIPTTAATQPRVAQQSGPGGTSGDGGSDGSIRVGGRRLSQFFSGLLGGAGGRPGVIGQLTASLLTNGGTSIPPAGAKTTTPARPKPGSAGVLDTLSLASLLVACDFIGISAYAALTPDFTTNHLQNSAFTFFREFKEVTGLDLDALMTANNIPLHYSEYGLGGGQSLDGTTVAVNAAQTALKPFYGVYTTSYSPAYDPWRTPEVRSFMATFWQCTLKWLAEGGGPTYHITACFMWTKGSYDILAIYPESTNLATGGTYLQPEVAAAIKAHNTRTAALNKAAREAGAAAAAAGTAAPAPGLR